MADGIYEVDYTGENPANRITNEQIVITAPGTRRYHFAMPKLCPFYEKGHTLHLRDLAGNVIPLVKDVDYYLSHKFADASLATMHPIYGSYSFLRRDIVGTLIATYQTLGGVWTIDRQLILEIIANTLWNPRVTTWEQVVERPIDFPVVDHPWNLVDMTGMKDIVDVLERGLTAFLQSIDPGSTGALIYNHINARGNVHHATPADIGTLSTAQINDRLLSYVKSTDRVFDSDRLGGRTLTQVIADAGNQRVLDTRRVVGMELPQFVLYLAGQLGSNATTLDGKSLAQIKTEIKQEIAAGR